ncbi:PIN domain-containing protein [Actinomadura sp. NTSP31]|uniref:PIN domain-containing protein n=1 Tax=Actinomadura sp. NTSP31 TaxID=1735447 RepID=UPI0035C232B7
MFGVIVMFDANVLIATSFHQLLWKVLAAASENRNMDVRVLIPKVSFEERVGKAIRDANSLIADLDAIARKSGDLAVFAQGRAALVERRDMARANLTRDAKAVGAELLDPVKVDHMAIVARQAARVRPCDQDGNGFRDTLNWLTVLDVAKQNPDQDIAWVSFDKDFAASPGVLHPELQDEADKAGVGDRLSLWPSLGALVKDLQDRHQLGTDTKAAHLALALQATQSYVSEHVAELLLTQDLFSSEDIIVVPSPADVTVEEISAAQEWSFQVDVKVIVADGETEIPGIASVGGTVTTNDAGRPVSAVFGYAEWNPDDPIPRLPRDGHRRQLRDGFPPELVAAAQIHKVARDQGLYATLADVGGVSRMLQATGQRGVFRQRVGSELTKVEQFITATNFHRRLGDIAAVTDIYRRMNLGDFAAVQQALKGKGIGSKIRSQNAHEVAWKTPPQENPTLPEPPDGGRR